MAKITRTQQRRLVASSIAFVLTAAIMMPTTTDARGGGGGHSSGGFHTRSVGILGFTNMHPVTPPVGFAAVRRIPPRHSHRRIAFRHSRRIGSDFVSLAPNGLWLDDVGSAPTIVFTQEAPITQEMARPRNAAVKTPDAEQGGIIVVRGNSKAYVTFPAAKPG